MLGETDKDGKLKKSYTRGQELISAESKQKTAGSAADIHYFLYDGHGSTCLLTDKDGNVTDRYSYDGYGNLIEKEGDTENDFLYTGEQYNYLTELYYLRARYMDPSTGTFISMDSYAGTIYDPVSLHKYLYANANPVMNTDPSGYTSLGELAAGEGAQISKIATEAFCNYVKVKALKGAIAGAVAGAVIGGIDSYLSGNDVTQIMLDALKGFLTGMGVGALISIALVYATFSAPVLIALKIFNYGMLVCGGYGVVLARDEGNGKLALFRAIITLGGFIGFSKLLNDIEFVPAVSIKCKYSKASFWERITTKTASVDELTPNPLDEFSNPKIGPSDSAVSRYIKEINSTGNISEPILVQKLANGGYEIVNGHHRWLAAIKTGLNNVPIKIINYDN